MYIIDDVREFVKQFINSELELDDNVTLFDLGINSINYIELIIKLEKKYNIEFSDEYLLNDTQTINSLNQYIVDKLYEKNIKMIISGEKLSKGKQLKGCMIYPDIFANGIANLGWQDIVWCTKEKVDWRIIFFDEEINLYDEILDFSIDEADIVLFSIPFESTYLNTVKMLKKYNLMNINRKPFVIAGGMSMINPFPLGGYFDAIVVGSGSHIINDIIEIIGKCGHKSDKLSKILRLDGIFSLLDRNKKVKAQISNPNHLYYSHWTSDSSCYELDRYFSIMISMGCNGVCPYCVVGNTQGNEKHNAINYSFDLVKTVLNNELPYHDPQAVKLFFASGESNILSTIQNFNNMGLNVRVGSLNVKQLQLDLLYQLIMNGQNEVTIAPETVQPLRKSIGKGYFTDELLFEKIELVSKQKMNLTLYYLCGLVEEHKLSISQFIKHIDRISDYIQDDTNVNIHYNPLFPKAQTPMQKYKMLNLDIIRECYGILKEKLSVDKRFSITSIIDDTLAFYQPILSLCDERVGHALYQLADIDNPSEEEWKLAFREAGININDFISLSYNDREIETPLCFSPIKY